MTDIAHEVRRPETGPVAPLGISVSIGALAVVIAAFVGALVPRQAVTMQWVLLAVVVGGFAVWVADTVATSIVAVLAFVLADGFLVNRLGELSWHGRADLGRLGVLAVAGLVGWVIGRLRTHHEAHRRVGEVAR